MNARINGRVSRRAPRRTGWAGRIIGASLTILAMVAVSAAVVESPASAVSRAVAVGPSEYEVDQAVAGTPPSQLPCASAIVGAAACFDKAGDKIWVKDTAADGASAVFKWSALRNGALYRYGMCINSLGNGRWGVCNKNFVEGAAIKGYVCIWDRDVEQEPVPCGNDSNMGTS